MNAVLIYVHAMTDLRNEPDIDDFAALLSAVRRNEPGAWRRFFRGIFPFLRKRARSLRKFYVPLGVSSLTQETALRFSRSIQSTQAKDTPQVKALLDRIMRNTARDAVRAERRAKRDATQASLADWLESPPGTPCDLLEKKEAQKRLFCALEKLPPRQRLVCVRLLEGVPLSDIAQSLGISLPAAQMLLQRAKAELAAQLSADEDSSGNLCR